MNLYSREIKNVHVYDEHWRETKQQL